MQAIHRRSEALGNFSPQVVKRFRVFLDTEQTPLFWLARFQVLFIADPERNDPTVSIGKSANRLQHAHMFVADAFEIQRAALMGGERLAAPKSKARAKAKPRGKK